MGNLYDSVTWENLKPLAGPKMGYVDGEVSAWPADAWATFAADPLVHMTVTADERWEAFDAEYGDAGQPQVAAAVANREQDGKWSVVYSSQDGLPTMTAALRSKGLYWRDAQYWPAKGVYLHVADPSGNMAAGRWRPPVTPVAVQTEWLAGYDVSVCYGNYPGVKEVEVALTQEDANLVAATVVTMLREEYAGAGKELFDRGIQFVNEGLKESGLTKPAE